VKPRPRAAISAATFSAMTSATLAQLANSLPSCAAVPDLLAGAENNRWSRAPQRTTEPEEPAPLRLWRTTAPAVVRSAPTDAAPELARLPTGAGLWLIEVGEVWSRVHGRAGVLVYTGYIRTDSITQTDW
jgi:hypothetical protein